MKPVDEILWSIYRGGNATTAVIWDDHTGNPRDLTGYAVEIFGEDKALTPDVLSAAIDDPVAGKVLISFVHADSLPKSMRFRLRIVSPEGVPQALPPWRIELT